MRTPYPNAMPLEEIQDVVSAVRAGTIQQHAPALVQDLWTVVGYALGCTLGAAPAAAQAAQTAQGAPGAQAAPGAASPAAQAAPGGTPAASRGPQPTLTHEQACTELEKALKSQQSEASGQPGAVAVNWAAVAVWAIQLLTAAITKIHPV